jgi:hypothetical protein
MFMKQIFIGLLVATMLLAGGCSLRDNDMGAVYDPVQDAKHIVAPSNGATATTTGGSLTAGTYYFKLTSVDYAGGQTTASSEFTCVRQTTGACVVTFTPTVGAKYNYLWVATSTGVYYGYISTATSSTMVATSTGLTAGTLPQKNTAYQFNGGADGFYLQAYVTADTLVKSGPTFVHSITYSPSDAAATAGSIAILDAIVAGDNATSTLYGVPGAAISPNTIILNQVFDTGLYVDFTTTADVNVNISYK